jgi:hypothetical protein
LGEGRRCGPLFLQKTPIRGTLLPNKTPKNLGAVLAIVETGNQNRPVIVNSPSCFIECMNSL